MECRPMIGQGAAVALLMAVTVGSISGAAEPFGGSSSVTSLLEFFAQRSRRQFTDVPRKVMAFYYTWYGTPEFEHGWRHWNAVDFANRDIKASTHYPLIGPYDSQDPEVIDLHIDQARRSGVDCFIATWWGRSDYTDEAFNLLLDRARPKGFEATVYWETVPGEGREQVRHAVADLVYLLRRYGRDPAFLKVDARPVIFVYGRVMGQIPQAAWPEIITRVRERVGHDFLLIADGYRESNARLFDGVHTYNICGWVRRKPLAEIHEDAEHSFTSAVELARQHGKISCITVIPGYDDTKIRDPGLVAERKGGDTYEALWQKAVEAGPDWVLITSWNEWHEGSEIEPSFEDGRKYLRLTARWARRFKRSPRPDVSRLQRAGLSDEQREQLQGAWGDVTIGLLPGYSGVLPMLLAESGLHIRELSWEDVIDPEVLAPEDLPLLIHAGGEHYTRSVREPQDVDDALRRYLSHGGVLLAAPNGPFPFYYDEEGEAVVAAPALGLPMVGSGRDALATEQPTGWEDPPDVEDLHFEIDTGLVPDLPQRVDFPGTGDLRWRPASEALLADGDLYVPLATLQDASGRSFGEGIAWIEHRQSQPVGGRVLYAWMRMDDVLEPERLYVSLLTFAAQQIAD
ncbi:MAG: glycoside hydrolase family 99-like domain-containing protein [Armatimonadota bacterium]|nr:glycoside hydrolase family 99-like domain-containing protein [Armatimonadota bacterium]